jgi:hypothetical protein
MSVPTPSPAPPPAEAATGGATTAVLPPVQERATGLPSRGQALAAAIFFASGASLVVHILTDALLPAVFGALLVGGAVLMAQAASDPALRARIVPLLRAGVIAGVVSTAVYDVSRYALAEAFDLHAKPFKALPYFGNALIGVEPHSTASWVAGVAFHLTNGVCFGIGYTVLAGRRRLPWAVGFALALEAFMLLLYPRWLQIDAMKEFTQMSVFGHVAYGLSLGLATNALLGAVPPDDPSVTGAGDGPAPAALPEPSAPPEPPPALRAPEAPPPTDAAEPGPAEGDGR